MGKGGNIRPSSLGEPGAIKPTQLGPARISFSFSYLDTRQGKFAYDHKETVYFTKLLDRFKHLSGISSQEMRTTHSKGLRCPPHDWSTTSEPRGFGLKGQLADCEGIQFQVSSNEHGRVHGFFLGEVFHVVWLDPDHQLYP